MLADDAKKVIAEQATMLARQGSYSLGTAKRILRNALSGNVTKHHPNPLSPTPGP